MARLVSGPLTATAKATAAVCGRPIRVIPPSAHSVTSCTAIFFLRAVAACAVSWSRRLPMSSTAPTALANVYTASERPGVHAGRVWRPRPYANRITSSGMLQCIRSGTPTTCPTRTDPFIVVSCRPGTRSIGQDLAT